MSRIFGSLKDFSRMDLFSFTNALLRPCGKSVYGDATEGIARITGVEEVDKELSSELGYPLFQETQMEFVMKFCGYSFMDADKLRKCIAKGSLVTMADGTLKPIEDVKVGDRVISYNEDTFSPQNVLNVWNNGTKEVVEVVSTDGLSVKCTKDHKFLTQDGWKQASELTNEDFIYTPKNIICDDDGLKSNQKLSNLQYWFIGALIGDGSIGQKWNLSFTNSEKCIIDKCIEALSEFSRECKYNVGEYPGKEVEKVYSLRVLDSSRHTMFNVLEKYGLRCTSKSKHIPDEIMRMNPTEKLASFISGLFNTDGGYNAKRTSIEYYTISHILIQQLRTLLLKFGIYSKITSSIVKGYGYKSYTLFIKGKKNLELFSNFFLPFIVGNKEKDFRNIIDSCGENLAYLLPRKCRDEISGWCEKRNISVRQLYKKCGLSEIKLSSKYKFNANNAKVMTEYCYAPYTYSVLNGDFMLVPVVCVNDIKETTEVYDIEVENTHNFLANNMVVHNCVAKKVGTREQLPKIKEGFYNHGKKDLNLTDEQAEAVIEPFCQCILDATRYSFCRIHAYSYSYIGYICAYLRYYYPIEYLTACLNIWKTKEDKTNECIEYARLKNIKILEPKFRHGRANYSFDKNNKVIYKGMLSIKYLNESCSNFLYSLKDCEYKNFVNLLYDISESKSLNSRQLDVLTKLDFFEEFGNSKELLRIINMFSFFKDGKAKNISKSKIPEENIVYSIIKRNSKETEKTFTQLNTLGILSECEELIKSWRIQDFSIKDKALTQRDFLGYINVITNKEEDRPKLLILGKRTLINKKTGNPWAISIEGQSLGKGKKNKYTIFYKIYSKEPFEELDLIYIDGWEKKGDYFYITKYHKIY